MRDAFAADVRRRPMRLRRLSQHPLRIIALIACVAGVPVTAGSQQTSGIRVSTGAHAVEERQREKALQALPSPENLREYMKTISAEPHHAGSAGSRKVAEYILGKFKSWGLNAVIEPFEALMPFPTERRVELLEPEKFVAALKEPVLPDDPDSG